MKLFSYSITNKYFCYLGVPEHKEKEIQILHSLDRNLS